MFREEIERLAAWASAADGAGEILEAKKDFFAKTGEVHEDDRCFEDRMSAFLEHFLFDRPLQGRGKTPAEAFLEIEGDKLSEAERVTFGALCRSLPAVFEVRKLGTQQGLRIRDILSRQDYEIFERRELVALSKGDIFNARIFPKDDHHIFASAFIYHPKEARKAILQEAKRRRKAEGAPAALDFSFELARLALKIERYRTVPIENIYRFAE